MSPWCAEPWTRSCIRTLAYRKTTSNQLDEESAQPLTPFFPQIGEFIFFTDHQ